MSSSIELHVEPRTDLGKGASRRLRQKADLVPAIIYGAGKDPVSITIPHNVLRKACEDEAFFAQIIKIHVKGGDTDSAIIKAMQRHPAKDRIMHADFMRVSMDHAIHVEVPLHFVNEASAVGVKVEGGMVTHAMSTVEISCLPGALPEFIEVDVAALKLGDSIHLSQIVLPEGVSIPELALGADHDHVVVSVVATRATVEAGSEAAAAPKGDGGKAS